MVKFRSIRNATVAVMAACLIPLAVAQAGEAAKLEVKVLDQQAAGSGEGGSGATYRMEVISVLRSKLRFKTGDRIVVRVPGALRQVPDSFAPGWIGTAYLIPDPNAGGAEAGRYVVAPGADGGLVDLPPTPPSATWTEYVYPDKTDPR